jgi:imidazolonepropionase-like amidohydrolase
MSEKLVLKNAFLIDGRGGEPSPTALVVVEDGLIKEVTDREAKTSSGRIIDLRGRTLLPGLMDAHVHPAALELAFDAQMAIPPAVFVHRTGRNLETDLNLGFTTERDACTLDVGFRAAIDQGFIDGPRLLLAASQIVQSGAEAYRPGFRLRETKSHTPLGLGPQICDGPDEVRRGARRALGLGADQIKIFVSGEVISQAEEDRTTPDQWKFTEPEIVAAVETAQAAGTYVMAHAYGPTAIQNCLRAGVRSIEHGNLMDAETAAMMAAKGAYYVPTLTAYHVLSHENSGLMTPPMREKLGLVLDKGLDALEMTYRAGVKIASGSDIVGPHQELKGREFTLKAEIMTPMETIVSATRTNAELMNIDDRLGTVETGKLADLIVVDGNPLDSLALLENGLETVVMVIKEGRIMKDNLTAG